RIRFVTETKQVALTQLRRVVTLLFLITSISNWHSLRYGGEAGLQLRKLDFDARALRRFAVDVHAVIGAEENLQPFVDVADPDASVEQMRHLLGRNTYAIVFNDEVK